MIDDDQMQLQNEAVLSTLAYARGVLNSSGSRRTAATWTLGDSVVELRYSYLEGQLLITPPDRTRPSVLVFRGRHPEADLEAVRLALTAAAGHGRLVS